MEPNIPISPSPLTGNGKHFPWLAVVVTLLLTALVVGIGGYLFFSWQSSVSQDDFKGQLKLLENDKTALQSGLTVCQGDLAICQKDLAALAESTEEGENNSANQDDTAYEGWNKYTDNRYGLSWRYPAGWSVQEKDNDPGISDKRSFTLTFTSPNNVILLVSYRKKTEANYTTWTRSGFGYNEMYKTAINLSVGGRLLTEKTVFGENSKVSDFVYAQNVRDDETGARARVAIGSYYFTFMATDMNYPLNGITDAEEVIIEKIMGSLKF